MTLRTITVFLVDPADAATTLEAAVTLATRSGAHLDVFCLGIELTQPEFYYTGSPMVLMPGAIEEAGRRAGEMEDFARKRLEKEAIAHSIVAAATPGVGVQSTVAEAARFSDLVISVSPYGDDRSIAMTQVVEATLFATEVPVLIVPDKLPDTFRRITVAWNDSPEALAAVRSALPLLREADTVEVVVIGTPSRWGDRGDGPQRLQQMLERHGVKATLTSLEKSREPVGAVLDRHVKASGADLLVMGAYGRSRLREAIMGGATRDTLENADFPVLMAH